MNFHKNFDVKWEDKSQVDEMVGAKDTQWTQLTELLVFLKPQSVISPATCFHIDLKSACLPRGHLPADGNVHPGPLGMSHHLRFCSTSWVRSVSSCCGNPVTAGRNTTCRPLSPTLLYFSHVGIANALLPWYEKVLQNKNWYWLHLLGSIHWPII